MLEANFLLPLDDYASILEHGVYNLPSRADLPSGPTNWTNPAHSTNDGPTGSGSRDNARDNVRIFRTLDGGSRMSDGSTREAVFVHQSKCAPNAPNCGSSVSSRVHEALKSPGEVRITPKQPSFWAAADAQLPSRGNYRGNESRSADAEPAIPPEQKANFVFEWQNNGKYSGKKSDQITKRPVTPHFPDPPSFFIGRAPVDANRRGPSAKNPPSRNDEPTYSGDYFDEPVSASSLTGRTTDASAPPKGYNFSNSLFLVLLICFYFG